MKKFIQTSISDFLNENSNNESNLILYHGSSNMKIYDKFKDNQFYTFNDYIASNYAYNKGGLLYKVTVGKLNPLSLIENNERMTNFRGEIGKGGPYLSGSDYYIQDIIKKLYGNDSLEDLKRYGMGAKLPYIVNGDFEPLIKYAKEYGYDSLKFKDESFDKYIEDITYIIFDGNKIKIKNIYEVYNKDGETSYKKIK